MKWWNTQRCCKRTHLFRTKFVGEFDLCRFHSFIHFIFLKFHSPMYIVGTRRFVCWSIDSHTCHLKTKIDFFYCFHVRRAHATNGDSFRAKNDMIHMATIWKKIRWINFGIVFRVKHVSTSLCRLSICSVSTDYVFILFVYVHHEVFDELMTFLTCVFSRSLRKVRVAGNEKQKKHTLMIKNENNFLCVLSGCWKFQKCGR